VHTHLHTTPLLTRTHRSRTIILLLLLAIKFIVLIVVVNYHHDRDPHHPFLGAVVTVVVLFFTWLLWLCFSYDLRFIPRLSLTLATTTTTHAAGNSAIQPAQAG
jgi:Na+/melibiose symporter-like transporter